jgi:hypothetical protein
VCWWFIDLSILENDEGDDKMLYICTVLYCSTPYVYVRTKYPMVHFWSMYCTQLYVHNRSFHSNGTTFTDDTGVQALMSSKCLLLNKNFVYFQWNAFNVYTNRCASVFCTTAHSCSTAWTHSSMSILLARKQKCKIAKRTSGWREIVLSTYVS